MVDKKDFESMRKELERLDIQREAIIKKSRDILADSKHAIYAVHNNDLKNGRAMLGKALKDIEALKVSVGRLSDLESVGAFSSAMQEYVEALLFLNFVDNGKLASKKETMANTEDYLMVLCDFTGELGRRTVLLASKKQFKDIENIKKMVDMINGELLQFNFRNGELRKKYDSVKWNLKKIEDVVYDLSLRGQI